MERPGVPRRDGRVRKGLEDVSKPRVAGDHVVPVREVHAPDGELSEAAAEAADAASQPAVERRRRRKPKRKRDDDQRARLFAAQRSARVAHTHLVLGVPVRVHDDEDEPSRRGRRPGRVPQARGAGLARGEARVSDATGAVPVRAGRVAEGVHAVE
eukprot:31363-Pelagococcus_subviridis.AAC.5